MLARRGTTRLTAAFADEGMDGLRPAHSLLLVPLLAGGRHASDLADLLGVSRQAVAQAVAALERDGFVQRVPDPGDARAKLICLTARGRAALRVMRGSALALERDWARRVGPDRLAELRETITALLTEPQ
jgi:DNA-binding MarR family transcriptional regulator